MTSYYARYHRLSQQTLDAYIRSDDGIRERLHFYFHYLADIIPHGVTIQHVPTSRYTHENKRQTFELRTQSGGIFMYGLVSMERRACDIERVAGDEAYTKHLDREFVRDDGTWRFFTGLSQLRVYCGFGGDSYELMSVLQPIRDAWEVAGYFQTQYDSMREH